MQKCTVLGVIGILCGILAGCSASNNLSEKALKLEAAGQYEEAAEQYFQALQENARDAGAAAGLERAGKRVLDTALEKFKKLYDSGDYRNAYAAYGESQEYCEKVSSAGVVLEIPPQYRSLFDENRRKLAEAAYQSGLNGMQDSRYKEAYRAFLQSLTYVPDYKDAPALMNDALAKAIVRVGFFPAENKTDMPGIHQLLHALTAVQVMQYHSPLIQIIDTAYLQNLLQDRHADSSGMIEEAAIAAAGREIGLQAAVFITLTGAKAAVPEIKSTRKKAFISIPSANCVGNMVPQIKEVSYKVLEGTKNVILKAQFQILDTESGKVMHAGFVEEENADNIKYAVYAGDYNELLAYDPYVAPNKRINVAEIDKSLFIARKEFLPSEEISRAIIAKLAKKISGEICRFLEK